MKIIHREIKVENKEKRESSSMMMLFISLVLLMLLFSILSKYFFTFSNLMNLLMYSSILGIASCGFTLVILAGSLDLSAGTLSALAAVYAARIIEWTGIWWLGALGGILIGFLGGCVNGFFVTKIRINPLITTLGTMTIFKGIAYLANRGISIPVYNMTFKKLGQGYFLRVPIIVWLLLLTFLLFYVVLNYTRFGREVYSVGGNAQASFLSGINVKRTRFKIYVTCSTCAGFAGVLYAALTGAGAPGANEDLCLEAISAIILGGAALTGGRGSIIGTFLGVLVLGTITNGLTLLNVSSFYQLIFKGIILLVAVTLDVFKGQGAYE